MASTPKANSFLLERFTARTLQVCGVLALLLALPIGFVGGGVAFAATLGGGLTCVGLGSLIILLVCIEAQLNAVRVHTKPAVPPKEIAV